MVDSTKRIEELRRELSANPTSRQFYQLGELLRREGQGAEAADVLRAGLAHHPRYVAAWVALGRACVEGGAAEQAVTALREALVLDAQNPVAWRLLGEAQLALGDRGAALDAMQRCLELVPGDSVLEAAVEALAAEPAQEAKTGPEEASASAEAAQVVPEEPSAGERSAAPLDEGGGAEDAGALAAPAAAPIDAAASEPFALEETAASTGDVFGVDLETAPVAARADADDLVFGSRPEDAAAVPEGASGFEAVESEIAPLAAHAREEASLGVVPPEPTAAAEAGDGEAEAEIAPSLPAEPGPAPPRATLALARLYVQQQDLAGAVAVLERVLARDRSNVEARELLALVQDMMEPLSDALPKLSRHERTIAALQRWLAGITLGRDRAAL
jgi:tetratricopeptide (TPR) repeat protein